MPFDKKEYNRLHYLKNKEKLDQQHNEYRKTPQCKKSQTIGSWKTRGLIDDYEKIYDIYLNTHECMKCNIEISGRNKCMDHDHITNIYRSVLCQPCNKSNSLDLHCNKDNKLGIKNISMTKDGYDFRKTIKGKTHRKWFLTLEEAIEYKNKYLLEFG